MSWFGDVEAYPEGSAFGMVVREAVNWMCQELEESDGEFIGESHGLNT